MTTPNIPPAVKLFPRPSPVMRKLTYEAYYTAAGALVWYCCCCYWWW